MNFRVGDRVRIKSGSFDYCVYENNIGTVVCYGENIVTVEWDLDQMEFWDCDGEVQSGRGYNCNKDSLEKIIKTGSTLSMILKINNV